MQKCSTSLVCEVGIFLLMYIAGRMLDEKINLRKDVFVVNR